MNHNNDLTANHCYTIAPDKLDIAIPRETTNLMQSIVDILTVLLNVPSALIMRVFPPYIEVFKASVTEYNPYHVGEREHLAGLYCDTVMRSNDKLLVRSALESEKWENNPDIKLGMISYLGYPLLWPDGQPFGTICVLDMIARDYSDYHQNIIHVFQEVIEIELLAVFEHHQLTKISSDKAQTNIVRDKSIKKRKTIIQKCLNDLYNLHTDICNFREICPSLEQKMLQICKTLEKSL